MLTIGEKWYVYPKANYPRAKLLGVIEKLPIDFQELNNFNMHYHLHIFQQPTISCPSYLINVYLDVLGSQYTFSIIEAISYLFILAYEKKLSINDIVKWERVWEHLNHDS